MEILRASPFDADAFGMPFYRVHAVDDSLAGHVRSVCGASPQVVIDAKVPADDLHAGRMLWSLGFRKVCMQITLRRPLTGPFAPPAPATAVSPELRLPESVLCRHAENFTRDRFSLDPLLPSAGVRRLFYNWIRNSLTQGAKHVVHVDDDFCTLSVSERIATIDLVSVLNPGRGIGGALVGRACALAFDRGATEIAVTTECENSRAWQLYVRAGFLPARFAAAFHLVQRP